MIKKILLTAASIYILLGAISFFKDMLSCSYCGSINPIGMTVRLRSPFPYKNVQACKNCMKEKGFRAPISSRP